VSPLRFRVAPLGRDEYAVECSLPWRSLVSPGDDSVEDERVGHAIVAVARHAGVDVAMVHYRGVDDARRVFWVDHGPN
jgi:hypothetical protein